MSLAERHAQRGKTPRLDDAAIKQLLVEVPRWVLTANSGHAELRRTLSFKSFKVLMAFVNQVADLAEAEEHHPDISIHYARLDLSLWTHDAAGLTENDFILAAKIDQIPQ